MPRTVLIGLRRILDRHSGKNIARLVHEVLKEYRIYHLLGCLMMDNATNNDTSVEELARLIPGITKSRRLRCMGHMLNLICKALLLGDSISKFEKNLIHANDEETFKLWREKGAIGKAHNIVKYIMRSDIRRQELNKIQKIKKSIHKDIEYLDQQVTALSLIKDGGGKHP
jgi:hypothetical protein